MGETLNGKDRIQFLIELILALIITGLASVAGLSNLIIASNDSFPLTADAMGHMTKVRFLAESFARGEFPSWFPYWYNGSTVTQYYPPLSYWIMAPIFMITKNEMLTYKIDSCMVIFIGGMGVWYFCRFYIGRWCGLFGTTVYCLQPFILRNLYSAGQLAQGPIIALLPWYLVALLAYSHKPSAGKFFSCTILCTLMILSHPNTTFMNCICIMFIFLIYVFLKKLPFVLFSYIGFSIIFSGVITAFWSIVGVTQLENPGIPYLLPEAVAQHTVKLGWFTDPYGGWFFFAYPVSIGSIAAIMVFAYLASVKKIGEEKGDNILFVILITIITVVFSFGLNLPLFKYIPMSESLVPGRILTLTSITGAILCAYLLFCIISLANNKKMSMKLFAALLCLSVIGVTALYMNPFTMKYLLIKENTFDKMSANISQLQTQSTNFDKGRFSYLGAFDCSESYFPILRNYNITEGWNIEGTPHHQTYRNFLLAIPSSDLSYVARNLAFWNVRSILMYKDYADIMNVMNEEYSFKAVGQRKGNMIYVSEDPSTYFFTDKRDALIMGAGSPGIAIEFPYLVNGKSDDITDYTLEELEQYRLIYLSEPAVDTVQDKKKIESIIKILINKGIIVLVEPTIAKGYSLFDVVITDVNFENSPVIQKQPDSKIISSEDNIEVDENMKYGRALFGLDQVYYKLVQNDGNLRNDIIGTKKVGNGEVIFIGKHLSQYLKAVYARNWGMPQNESGFPACSSEVKALFEDIFTTYGVNKEFWPDPFPIKKAEWNYKGVDFEYSSHKTQETTLSVTYTPRWKATIDGKPIEIGQRENLITINLPAGEHHVKLVYGLTKYGVAGYIISVVGLLIFILFIKFYDIILDIFRQISVKLSNFLQLGNDD